MIITWIARLFAALNSNTKPRQISAAIAFAFLLSCFSYTSPGWFLPFNLLWISLFIITFFLKINQAIELMFLAIFKLITIFLEPLFSIIGEAILKTPFLYDNIFSSLYNVPFLFFTRFNHTVVMGGLIVGILLFAPMYLLSNLLVKLYREHLREKLANLRIVKALQKQPIFAKLSKTFRGAYNFYSSIR